MHFINSKQKQCGIYQYGLRIYTVLRKQINIEYHEVGTLEEYLRAVAAIKHRVVLVNYHSILFAFLHIAYQCPSIKYYYIWHEGSLGPVRPGYMLHSDPDARTGIPRPLPMMCDTQDHPPTDFSNPIIGSFGFGSPSKGFDLIVRKVQDEFDTATIRLVIPFNEAYDQDGNCAKASADACRLAVTKPGITLEISHDFVTDDEIIQFLSKNDLNIFLYTGDTNNKGRSCSSVVDFALCADRPIAVSSSEMFRHVYKDDICAEKRTIRQIIEFGTDHVKALRSKWSHEALTKEFRIRLGLEVVPRSLLKRNAETPWVLKRSYR
jgi:hypothetical protein